MEEDEKLGALAVNPSVNAGAPSAAAGRQLFAVELEPDVTTIVSWKKLTRDARCRDDAGAAQPAPALPALESRIVPAGTSKNLDERKDEPPTNHFSAVIEKIERLYMGHQSSDEEELGNIPDDDEYDTEDSFIDDAELDEYFQVDTSETKHNGFFVNKGKLERINAPVSSTHHTPKKRKRKELKAHNEFDSEDLSTKCIKVGGVGKKENARNVTTSTGEDYQEIIKSSAKHSSHSGFLPKKPTDFCKIGYSYSDISNKDVSARPVEAKDAKRHKVSVQPEDLNNKSYISGEALDSSYNKHQARKSQNDLNGYVESSSNIRHQEKYAKREVLDLNFDLNLPGSKYPMKSVSLPPKESLSVRPKGTVLERAIRDLEKVVAESRPPGTEIQESDATLPNVKRRIPQDIKQKLAKVARLASSQGKMISDELISRLMGILGHLVQLKTLKKHLKEMIELGLSAKQQKADRFQHVKTEVVEMIRARVPLLKSKAAGQQDSADDFQEDKGSFKASYVMDEAMEDKICDLYELYVEGIDENKGPQSRKLYVELAELWPSGTIDSYGIKNAVNRARERKKQIYSSHKHGEKIKRKKASSSLRAETTGIPRLKDFPDSPYLGFSSDRPATHPSASEQYVPAFVKPSVLALHASVTDRPKVEKVKSRFGVGNEEEIRGGLMQKKPKRKSELGLVGMPSHSSTLALHEQGNEQKFFSSHSSMNQKTGLSMGMPDSEQTS